MVKYEVSTLTGLPEEKEHIAMNKKTNALLKKVNFFLQWTEYHGWRNKNIQVLEERIYRLRQDTRAVWG